MAEKVLEKLAPSQPFHTELTVELSLMQPSTSTAISHSVSVPSSPVTNAAITAQTCENPQIVPSCSTADTSTPGTPTKTLENSIQNKLTPKSSLEKAILNHLKFRENPKTTKNKRIRRSLAESLTNKDVRDRIEQEQKEREFKNKNKEKGKKRLQKTNETDTVSKRSKAAANKTNDVAVVDEDSDCLDEPELDSSDDEIEPPITVHCGQWVLIKFSVGKANKALYYVGQVCETDHNGQTSLVTFLRKVNESNFFVWPEREDIMSVETVQIDRILGEPTIDRRHRLTFNDAFEKFPC